MKRLIAFFILSSIKTISTLFYRGDFRWTTPKPTDPWKNLKLMVFMHHTSLFEPLFIQALSYKFLWQLSARMNVPGADVTLNRPIVGAFWKLMFPGIASVTRKKDNSWNEYISSIKKDSIIMIAPEGRMKRPNGMDKFGKPMTIRGGVADVLEGLDEGGMILALSGGLHHVQAPGQLIPRIFKTIRLNLVYLNIQEYKKQFSSNSRERKIQIVQDLQRRLENDCPQHIE